mgnify:CR=1 FL=1
MRSDGLKRVSEGRAQGPTDLRAPGSSLRQEQAGPRKKRQEADAQESPGNEDTELVKSETVPGLPGHCLGALTFT